jgi:serine/threonine protein kinase
MDLVPKIWADLKPLGFDGSIRTAPELYKWLLYMKKNYKPTKCIAGENTLSGPRFIYKDIKEYNNGSYGDIYTANQCKDGQEKVVFIKKCPKYPRILIMESFLQQIAYSILNQYGFKNSVPQILDILDDPATGVVCAIEHIPNTQIFSNYLIAQLQQENVSAYFDHVIFEIIAQVATYMCILENTFYFNHRDLKSNNILVILPTEEWTQTVTVGSHTWSIRADCKAILIDFGMSCIGTSTGKVIASADTSMMTGLDLDFCPKEGRDLFLFFVNLWNIPALRNALSPKAKQLFHKWLKDKSGRHWAEEFLRIPITEIANNFKLMCRRVNLPLFRSETCNPFSVLRDIGEAYPDIVNVQIKMQI